MMPDSREATARKKKGPFSTAEPMPVIPRFYPRSAHRDVTPVHWLRIVSNGPDGPAESPASTPLLAQRLTAGTDRDHDRCQTVWIARLSRMEAPVDPGTLTSGFCLSSYDATVDTRNGGEPAGNALGNSDVDLNRGQRRSRVVRGSQTP